MAFRIPGQEPPPPINPEFQRLIERGNVTLAEYKELRGNTRDWEAIVPAIDDEALAHVVEHCAKNMSPAPRVTYDGAMQAVYIPEVIKRLRARAKGGAE